MENNEAATAFSNQPYPTQSYTAANEIAISPNRSGNAILPQCGEGGGCSGGADCTCGGKAASTGSPKTPSYVYAIGAIQARFPNLGLEKEFAQATGRADTRGIPDRALLHELLTRPENRYIARQMCFVLTSEGMDTYILIPRDPADLNLLLQSLRAEPNALDIDVVIGMRGPIAPPQLCNGLMIPIVMVDQVYSFDRPNFIKSIPLPSSVEEKQAAQFRSAADDLLGRIMQMADNAGATDEHRALNYLAVRYPAIYTYTTQQNQEGASLSFVETRPSRLAGTRKIVDVIFSFTNRTTGMIDKFFVRVDVTEEFPFLFTVLQPYFDR